ncbi:30S ribosomal protein S8 [Candidatus Woesearchaeota archaeon]|nr:30S ribosomal protein S8 [Candidatus Woesearchaeota archaeon]
MTNNDPLANVLSHILNYERKGKQAVRTAQNSTLIKGVLRIMQDNGYLGSHEEHEDSKGNLLEIHLIGAINQCGVIKPRFRIGKDGYEKYEQRFLPSKDFGIIIISTSKGLMTHQEAKAQGIGGTLISYCY